MKMKMNNNINYARQYYYERCTVYNTKVVGICGTSCGIHGVNHPCDLDRYFKLIKIV